MSQRVSQPPRTAARHPVRTWGEALAAVAAGMAAMAVVAALGLWAAGANGLPGGAFPAVVAATMVTAVGGSVELSGGAGAFGRTGAHLDVVPLSVTLAGALAVAAVFLRPLRHHAVARGGELLARVARTAVLWLVALALLTRAARHTFRIELGSSVLDEIGAALGATPTVGFRAAAVPTLGFGLLWLLVLLAVAVAVSRGTPLPSRLLRFQDAVRPAAFAMVAVLLAYVAVGLLVGLVVLCTHGHRDRTLAVLLLGLPNLAWLAFGVGLGGAWDGRVPDSIGLPVPQALAAVLRVRNGTATVNYASLSQQDDRAWLLVVLAAAALLAAGFVTAVRSPAGTRPWHHATRLAAALALTLLVVGLLTRISARFGLSLLGVGDVSAFGGEVTLRPRLWGLLGLG
ncbi:streptophobe family protein, partial [Streptomyces sp. UNOC14_S4]|uniref:streptophobe family protein n=1 Tax=Streptomyces sp. UNOC14_S4 TaxID=2872340 RepID=UPI001E5CF692